jgi:hypothetical protein
MGSVSRGTMFLVVNASNKFWDGWGWSEQGKEFLTVASATRSLHEEGEDTNEVVIVPSSVVLT